MSTISINDLAYAIYESSKGKDGEALNEILNNTVLFLNKNYLINKKEELLLSLEKIIDKENGVIRVNITSSSKIKNKERDNIINFLKKKYKDKEIILIEKEDSKLLGGVKIQIEDEVTDLTIKNKLNQLENYLIN